MTPYGHPSDSMWETHPNVMAYLCNRTWDDILPREIPRLTITAGDRFFSFSLALTTEANKVADRVMTLAELWDRLEVCLREHEGSWTELDYGPGADKLRVERKKLLDAKKERRYLGPQRGEERE